MNHFASWIPSFLRPLFLVIRMNPVVQSMSSQHCLRASPNLLAAWQAEHGDVFVVVAGAESATVEAASAGAIVVEDGAAHVFDDAAAADQAVEPKAKRK